MTTAPTHQPAHVQTGHWQPHMCKVAIALVLATLSVSSAVAVVVPENVLNEMQRRWAAFIQTDGYTRVKADFPGKHWYSPSRFPGIEDWHSVQWPDHNLNPVSRMLLMVESREPDLPHVRYRVTYRLSGVPGDYANVQHAYVEITRFNLGPVIRKAVVSRLGPELAGPKAAYGVGPNVSWRFVTGTAAGFRSYIIRASRKVLSEDEAQAADCLGVPCLSLAAVTGPAGEWQTIKPPELEPAHYDETDTPLPGPARVAEYLFAHATDGIPEAAFGAYAGQPQMVFVISMNVTGQAATANGVLHQPHLMDHAISDLWTQRLQAGPHAIQWHQLQVYRHNE